MTKTITKMERVYWGLLLLFAAVILFIQIAQSMSSPILNISEMEISKGVLTKASKGGRGLRAWLTVRLPDNSEIKFQIISGKTEELLLIVGQPITVWSQNEPGAWLVNTVKEAMQIQHEERLVLNYDKEIMPGRKAAKSDRSGFYIFSLIPVGLLGFALIFFFGKESLFTKSITNKSGE